MPYKSWSPGDTITAADIMTYHMNQAVMVFASEDERDAALAGNLQEGMVAFTGSDVLTQYNGTAWVFLS